MIKHVLMLMIAFHLTAVSLVSSVKQQVQLSDSYLPVAMQIIAHLSDQMAFETRDDVTPSTPRPATTQSTTTTQTTTTTKPNTWTSTNKPLTWSTTKPNSWTTSTKPFSWTTSTTTKPNSWTSTTTKPNSWTTSTTKPNSWMTSATTKPSSWITSATTKPNSWTTSTTKPSSWTTSTTAKPSPWFTTTTPRPYVTSSSSKPTNNGWWMGFTTTKRSDITTPFHKPGLYAPFSPPKPFINRYQSRNFLLPIYNAQYTVLGPQESRSEDPLLGIHVEEVGPLVEPSPEGAPLLPPQFDVEISSRSDGFLLEDVSDESLQYLSDDVRDMIRMAKDPHDERVVDIWERAGAQPTVTTKAKLSGSNLRLLLLYDLLSRDAKKQRLSDYSGFSPDVMKVLVESSTGGARQQLRTALAKMVERHDCTHDYANNRAKEMVEELAKDESKLSSELRYLEPLIYKY